MGPDHLLLREAVCRPADDRMQPVRRLGAPVVCKDQEVQRSRYLLLPQVQGLEAVRTQKRHLDRRGLAGSARPAPLTLVFFDAYSQNSLNSLGRQL